MSVSVGWFCSAARKSCSVLWRSHALRPPIALAAGGRPARSKFSQRKSGLSMDSSRDDSGIHPSPAPRPPPAVAAAGHSVMSLSGGAGGARAGGPGSAASLRSSSVVSGVMSIFLNDLGPFPRALRTSESAVDDPSSASEASVVSGEISGSGLPSRPKRWSPFLPGSLPGALGADAADLSSASEASVVSGVISGSGFPSRPMRLGPLPDALRTSESAVDDPSPASEASEASEASVVSGVMSGSGLPSRPMRWRAGAGRGAGCREGFRTRSSPAESKDETLSESPRTDESGVMSGSGRPSRPTRFCPAPPCPGGLPPPPAVPSSGSLNSLGTAGGAARRPRPAPSAPHTSPRGGGAQTPFLGGAPRLPSAPTYCWLEDLPGRCPTVIPRNRRARGRRATKTLDLQSCGGFPHTRAGKAVHGRRGGAGRAADAERRADSSDSPSVALALSEEMSSTRRPPPRAAPSGAPPSGMGGGGGAAGIGLMVPGDSGRSGYSGSRSARSPPLPPSSSDDESLRRFAAGLPPTGRAPAPRCCPHRASAHGLVDDSEPAGERAGGPAPAGGARGLARRE